MFSRLRSLQTTRSLPLRSRPTTAIRPSITTLRNFSLTPRRLDDRTEAEVEDYVRGVKQFWGDKLPEDLLTTREIKIYTRYFGEPLEYIKETEEGEEADVDDLSGTMTLEDAQGREVEVFAEDEAMYAEEAAMIEEEMDRELDVDEINRLDELAESMDENEVRAYKQLQRDIEKAYEARADERREMALHKSAREDENPEYEPEEEPEEDEEYEDADDSIRGLPSSYLRAHPLTRIGKFTTFPATIEPPNALTDPTTAFLSEVANKHLDAAAQRLYGEQLEDSPIATAAKKNNSAMWPIHPSNPNMSDVEADVHFATVMPGLHAQTLSALSELRRRLGREWVLSDVKRILDVGTGGAGVIAWKNIVTAEEEGNGPRFDPAASKLVEKVEEALEGEETEEAPGLKASVVTASPSLRFRASKMLENTTFLPRLPDWNPTNSAPSKGEDNQLAQPRKHYDLIIANNSILPIKEDFKRKYHIQNLWSLLNPNGGVLVLIEKGNPAGFEAIAGARQMLLKNNIASAGSEFAPTEEGQDVSTPQRPKDVGQIVAPCTNHEECPMYLGVAGLVGRKDFCRFQQRYIRPGYMQRVLSAGATNFEDVEFSYVAVRRGIDTRTSGVPDIKPVIGDFPKNKDRNTFAQDDTRDHPNDAPVPSPYPEEHMRHHFLTAVPRVVMSPLKRKGHVTLDLCTPAGKIERWTVPKSHSPIAYRDARKARWGDLWPLGAKTKVLSNVKVGRPSKNGPGKGKRGKSPLPKDKKVTVDGEGEVVPLKVDVIDKVAKRQTKKMGKAEYLKAKRENKEEKRMEREAKERLSAKLGVKEGERWRVERRRGWKMEGKREIESAFDAL